MSTILIEKKIILEGKYQRGDVEKDSFLTIKGEVFEEAIFPNTPQGAVHSRITLQLDVDDEPAKFMGLRYFPGKLTDTELDGEVMAAAKQPTAYMYEDMERFYNRKIKIKALEDGHSKGQ
jgi:hypothetical protein